MKIKRLLKSVMIVLGCTVFASDDNSFATNIDISSYMINDVKFSTEGVYVSSVIETQDKEIITIGYQDSSIVEYGYDGIITKHDSEGNLLWVNKMSTSKSDLFFQSGLLLDNGDIIVVGDDSDSTGIYALIIKYDKDGNLIWKKTMNDTFFCSATICSDGNIGVAGGDDSAIIAKYDINGNLLWNKSFNYFNVGFLRYIKETKSGGFIAVGESIDNVDSGLIIKCDKDGNELWHNSLVGSGRNSFTSVLEMSDGGYIAVGKSSSTNIGFNNKGSYDAIIVKYDKDGNQEWIKNYGGNNQDSFSDIIKTFDGGFIAVGESMSIDLGFINKGRLDIIIVKYDEDGNQEWIKSFGSSGGDESLSITITPGGGLEVISDYRFDGTESIEKGYYMTKHYYNENYEEIFEIVSNTESSSSIPDLKTTRELINNMPEGVFKEHFQERLNSISIADSLELKTATANLDICIKSENMLSLSLDTNSVTFEDFSGVEDMEKLNAVSLTVNSSLPYKINAYLTSEIQNSDKSKTMDKDILNIKESSEVDYQTFNNTIDAIVIKDNNLSGNNINHSIDLMLKGGIAHEKDVYKTTIKFEAIQK